MLHGRIYPCNQADFQHFYTKLSLASQEKLKSLIIYHTQGVGRMEMHPLPAFVSVTND